jgi:phosphate transport system protein
VKPYVDLPRMSELAEGMVRDSLNALVRGDIELAHSVLQRDDLWIVCAINSSASCLPI